jgi:acyl-CoA synthetase (AMP-forming)/AMP-acid ligase II
MEPGGEQDTLMAHLSSLISRSAAWFGASPAVVDGDRALSFAEVEDRSNRVANLLQALTDGPGVRVALLIPNRLELVEIDLGIIKAGFVKVPINTRLKNEERAWVVQDSGATVLLFDGSEEESAAAVVADVAEPIAMVRVGPGTLGANYEDVLASASGNLVKLRVKAHDPSLILYTSGTTGRPKGATISRAARLMGTINMLSNEIDPHPGDAMAHVGSMAHGSGSKILAHFVRGSRNIPVAKWNPEGFLALAEQQRVTHSFLVPTMIESLVDAAATSQADWTSLSAITYGGAPMAPSRLERALETIGQRFVQVYGSCEAPHPVLVLNRDDHIAGGERLGSAGRESVGIETRIVTAQGEVVAEGESGELSVRGPSVMSGYWNNPEATAEVLHDGWYDTGDVVRRDADGFVHIVDRARDVIITGGYNVYPAELEAVLARHTDVLEVAVIGVPDEYWGESVKAIVVTGRDVPESEILDHCAGLVAGYKRPRSVDFVDVLPKGSTGKVLRRDLRDRYWEGRTRRV